MGPILSHLNPIQTALIYYVKGRLDITLMNDEFRCTQPRQETAEENVSPSLRVRCESRNNFRFLPLALFLLKSS